MSETSDLEKVEAFFGTMNAKAKADLFKLEDRDGAYFFVLDIPGIGKLIEIPLEEMTKK